MSCSCFGFCFGDCCCVDCTWTRCWFWLPKNSRWQKSQDAIAASVLWRLLSFDFWLADIRFAGLNSLTLYRLLGLPWLLSALSLFGCWFCWFHTRLLARLIWGWGTERNDCWTRLSDNDWRTLANCVGFLATAKRSGILFLNRAVPELLCRRHRRSRRC